MHSSVSSYYPPFPLSHDIMPIAAMQACTFIIFALFLYKKDKVKIVFAASISKIVETIFPARICVEIDFPLAYTDGVWYD